MNTPQEFAPLLAGLRTLPCAQGAALATLLRTRGATFRRAGARMLVYGDGRILRGLSAGCPEQDIAARAREAIVADAARIVRYDREHGYDALLEMGCGGELEVLIEPLREAVDWAFAEQVDRVLQARESGVMATLFARAGHCLARPRRWLWSPGLQVDALDDADLSMQLREHAARLPARSAPRVLTLASKQGQAEVLLERLLPPCAALLFGINASALALARVLTQLGWGVRLINHAGDDDSANLPLPAGAERLHCPPTQVSATLTMDARTFAVVMTHNLERDLDYLRALRDAPLAYLGAVGARRRAAQLIEVAAGSRTPLRSPAGLDIGSETPEEIAIAIAAEMLAVANGTGGGPLCATQAPIHRST